MIRPPGGDGVAFSQEADGDIRNDAGARQRLSRSLRVPADWATVQQVHGSQVARVERPGSAGPADALWTEVSGLPIAVFTADCLGVVLIAGSAVGVAHAGWRGARSGVVAALREEMAEAGHAPYAAFVGPGIAECCFEVGPEVSDLFPGHVSTTSWGTTSVDLAGYVTESLDDLEVWVSRSCTRHDPGWYSHRRDGTKRRLAALGWL